MTEPSREQVEEWVSHANLDWHKGFTGDDDPVNRYETLARLAFAAGARASAEDARDAELFRALTNLPIGCAFGRGPSGGWCIFSEVGAPMFKTLRECVEYWKDDIDAARKGDDHA